MRIQGCVFPPIGICMPINKTKLNENTNHPLSKHSANRTLRTKTYAKTNQTIPLFLFPYQLLFSLSHP